MIRHDTLLCEAVANRQTHVLRIILPIPMPSRNALGRTKHWHTVRKAKDLIQWAVYETLRANLPERDSLPRFKDLQRMSDPVPHLVNMRRCVSTFTAQAGDPLTMEISMSKLLLTGFDCRVYYKMIGLKMPSL